jgi:hypothetical protein
MNARPEQVIELVIDIDYGQVYIYGRAPWDRPGAGQKESDAVLRALDDARASGLMVGSDSGLIDLLSPVPYHYHAPVELELWAQRSAVPRRGRSPRPRRTGSGRWATA